MRLSRRNHTRHGSTKSAIRYRRFLRAEKINKYRVCAVWFVWRLSKTVGWVSDEEIFSSNSIWRKTFFYKERVRLVRTDQHVSMSTKKKKYFFRMRRIYVILKYIIYITYIRYAYNAFKKLISFQLITINDIFVGKFM